MRWRIPTYLAIATLFLCASASTAAAQESDSERSESASATSSAEDPSSAETDGGDGSEEGTSEDGDETDDDGSSEEGTSEDGDETDDGDDSEERESAHGSYEWKPSYGGGLEYGLFFTGLERWNTHLLEPNNAGEFDTTALSTFTFALEASLLEGSRLTLFGGAETPFSDNPDILAVYGGIEPAFAFRRDFWELALGFGVGVGNVTLTNENDTNDDTEFSAGVAVLRPAIEVRRYFNELAAGYLRFGFNQWLPFDGQSDALQIQTSSEQIGSESLLQEGGVYAALGVRFGHYPEHKKVVPDSDGDGLRDDVDDCPDEPEDEDGFEDNDGCPDEDNDGDGVPDADDECPDKPEDEDGFEDDDGCPDRDNDGDGLTDEEDECPDEPEDEDGFEDDDGCPDPDNDGDEVMDEEDECPDETGIPSNDGCPSKMVRIEESRLVVDAAIAFEAETSDDGETDDGETDEDSPRTVLTSDSKEALDTVAEVLAVHPELAKIEIRAHTGEGDDEKAKKEESQKRADAVHNYLTDAGVADGRLTANGMGVSKPMKPDGADEKKPVSRVEFHIKERSESEDTSSSDSSSDE